ncbi:MAG: hypothetical protein AAGB13_17215, partial [Cyanobacteria bacterium P01_F01_bin.33]
MKRSSDEKADTIAGLVALLTAIITAIAGLITELSLATEYFGPLISDAILLTVAFLLLVTGTYLLIRGIAKKSRVLNPDVFTIRQDSPDHLKGRNYEIENLYREIQSHSLIFLEGESGIGKTSLVKSGLIPLLQNTAKQEYPFEVIYINNYSRDWQSLLESDLATYIKRQSEQENLITSNLTEAQIKELFQISGHLDLLKEIRDRISTTPIIILDQFDDYQAENLGTFFRNGRWINSQELQANSVWWRFIGQAVRQELICLLIITRQDMMAGLNALRFVEPQVLGLERLQPEHIRSVFDSAVQIFETDQPAIAFPEYGWFGLRDRIVHDLSQNRRILPIQAKIALERVAQLPYLTVAAYERAGGLRGLEHEYVDDGLRRAGRSNSLSPEKMEEILYELIDVDTFDFPKATNQSLAKISEATNIETQILTKLFESMASYNLVRKVSDGNESQQSWSIYHDYLCAPILQRREISPNTEFLLQQEYQSFTSASGSYQKFQHLLSMPMFIRVVFLSFTGKLKTAGYNGYIGLSLLSFWPALVVASFFAFVNEQRSSIEMAAATERVVSALRSSDTPGENVIQLGWSAIEGIESEVARQMWELSLSSLRARRHFLQETRRLSRQEAESETTAILIRNSDIIAHSAFGLDLNREFRQATFDEFMREDEYSLYEAHLLIWILNSDSTFVSQLSSGARDRLLDTALRYSDSQLVEEIWKHIAPLSGLDAAVSMEKIAATYSRELDPDYKNTAGARFFAE